MVLGISKLDYEAGQEDSLEIASCERVLTLSKVPSGDKARIRRWSSRLGSNLPICWNAMNHAGFPALFTPMAANKGEIKLSTLFLRPLEFPFVQRFIERYDHLRHKAQTPSTVVGVVFRWPGVAASMILRDGRAPQDSAIAIRIQGKLRFVETLDRFVIDTLDGRDFEWWADA